MAQLTTPSEPAVFLVGGAVRDRLLNRPVKDRDFVVFGATEAEFLRRFPGARKVGRRSPVYLYRGDEYTLSPAADILDDLALRDLTINALAQDADGRIWAHPKAREDIDGKVLRPIAEKNFISDPLRVFRVARFAACMPDFNCHESVDAVVGRVRRAGLLGTVSAERVGQETLKALAGPRPGTYLRFLADRDLMQPWFCELAAFGQIPAGPAPYHNESVLEHTMQVMDRLAGDPLQVWMGLCHDIGKTATDPDRWPAHHGHERLGESLAGALARRLRLPTRFADAGAVASRWHMTLGRYRELRPGTLVDLLIHLHRHRLVSQMARLVVADGGDDLAASLAGDLDTIMAVALPAAQRGLGQDSGRVLRQLRCEALARRRRSIPSDERRNRK
jgi:tRNA nucleotidyltransferase (CCA-adding enzyme)